MLKKLFLFPVLILTLSTVFAQGGAQARDTIQVRNAGSSIQQMDNAVRKLAEDLNGKLVAEKIQKIAVTQFVYREYIPLFGEYLVNQLTGELTNISNRSFSAFSGGLADWIISGEIIDAVDTIRVYTRLIRTIDRAIEAVFYTDFEKNEYLVQMLFSGDSRSGSSSSFIPADAWEPDSMDNPMLCEIGEGEDVLPISRTLHNGNDQDFFLLVPQKDGRLIMITAGNDIDTYMELYNADTRNMLTENDDGGIGTNAHIRYNVEAGQRYIVKIRGYDRDEIGHYDFSAYFQIQQIIAQDEYESDDDPSLAKLIEIGMPQQHVFHDEDDIDWVKFHITQRGRYTIKTRGLNSNNLDTYIELYDEDLEFLFEDDDGGEYLDSYMSRRLDTGLYYLKVTYIGDDPDQPYIISIEAE